MKRLLITIGAAALVATPLAAPAQDRDGYQGDARDGYARPATANGYDATARGLDRGARQGGARHDDVDGGRMARDRFDGRRFDGDRNAFYRRDRDGGRLHGGVAFGFGYGGYPYGGGYYAGGYPYGGYDEGGGYPYGGYGAPYAYAYPDAYGTYQPFEYDYSASGDAYYPGLAAYGGYGYRTGPDAEYGYGASPGGGYGYQTPPDAGWSAGGPPVDCGRWIWRDDRGAYRWVPAPCARGPYGP